jgi:hypothetical protein
MTQYRYPTPAMVGDYLRAAFGLALTGTPLLMAPGGSFAFWILGPLALLFAVFGLRTGLRHMTVVEADESRVASRHLWRRELAWSEVTEVKLSYFSTKRDRRDGWMQLTLKSPGARIRFDSTLDGFGAITRRAHSTALAKGLELTDATIANFASLGFQPPKSDL